MNLAKKKKLSSGDILFNCINYTVFILFALICTFPFYYIFINTISDNNLSAKGLITFLPKNIQFQNYANILHLPNLGNAALVSVGRTVLGTIGTVLGSAFLGYLFTKNMWHRKFWYRFIIITMYFNAGLIPWYMTMKNLGLTNNFLAYVIPGIVSSFNIILVKTFIESIPASLQEAAQIDGAGILTIFVSIVFPLIKPILATIAIFTAVGQWNAFSDTLILMTDQKLFTLQYVLYQYLNQASSIASVVRSSQDLSKVSSLATKATPTSIQMTISIIVVLPILLVYPYFQRFFVTGIMIGSVKG